MKINIRTKRIITILCVLFSLAGNSLLILGSKDLIAANLGAFIFIPLWAIANVCLIYTAAAPDDDSFWGPNA